MKSAKGRLNGGTTSVSSGGSASEQDQRGEAELADGQKWEDYYSEEHFTMPKSEATSWNPYLTIREHRWTFFPDLQFSLPLPLPPLFNSLQPGLREIYPASAPPCFFLDTQFDVAFHSPCCDSTFSQSKKIAQNPSGILWDRFCG